jgi:glutamate racemase
MLGLFDSGLGGLTVVRRVRELLPLHDLVFLADQAHVPYGDRSADDLYDLLRRNLGWLDSQDVGGIVMACNTSCAIADVRGYPSTHAPVLDLIESAAIAMRDAGFGRIGVIATAATVRTGAYGRKLRALMPHARVHEVAAPALVPLVEAGTIDGDEPRAAVAAVCQELPDDVEAVILACTHYPVLDAHFAAVLGSSVARVDPAVEQAGRAAALVASRGIAPGSGHTRYVTTGDVELFHANVSLLMAKHQPHCEAATPGT